MKRLLQLGFILGLLGTLAAAHFLPWPQYQRYPSDTSVVSGGGRMEQFVIRLPADRIELAGSDDAATADSAAPQIEHFKLRDVKGNVIGIAARHRTTVGGKSEKAWLIGIPSRGSIVLAAPDASDSIEAVLTARGFTPDGNREQDLSVDVGGPAHSVATSGEFEGIEFELVETWVVSGVDENGEIQGTLRLNTLGRRAT
ncbi:MAG: hypothetical protein ACWGPN_02475 [Gammaproteobacteria bacterium]